LGGRAAGGDGDGRRRAGVARADGRLPGAVSQMRVPPQQRRRASLQGTDGVDALRALGPGATVRPPLRRRSSPAFDFLAPDLSLDALQRLAARTLVAEVRDSSAARIAFARDLWPWPEVPADSAALRLTIAGLRSH